VAHLSFLGNHSAAIEQYPPQAELFPRAHVLLARAGDPARDRRVRRSHNVNPERHKTVCLADTVRNWRERELRSKSRRAVTSRAQVRRVLPSARSADKEGLERARSPYRPRRNSAIVAGQRGDRDAVALTTDLAEQCRLLEPAVDAGGAGGARAVEPSAKGCLRCPPPSRQVSVKVPLTSKNKKGVGPMRRPGRLKSEVHVRLRPPAGLVRKRRRSSSAESDVVRQAGRDRPSLSAPKSPRPPSDADDHSYKRCGGKRPSRATFPPVHFVRAGNRVPPQETGAQACRFAGIPRGAFRSPNQSAERKWAVSAGAGPGIRGVMGGARPVPDEPGSCASEPGGGPPSRRKKTVLRGRCPRAALPPCVGEPS